jgi:hypothetical protein
VAEPQQRYERIPGSPAFLSQVRSELWWEGDHLLLVRRGSFTESYRRLYLADVQALSIRKTGTGRVVNAVAGAMAVTCLVYGTWAAIYQPGAVPMVIAAVLLLPLAVTLVVNTALGPTCECHAKTAVQAVKLPSLSRLRTARRAMGMLKPLIEAAQGAIPAGDAGTQATQALQALAEQGSPLAHQSGRFHQILCYLLLFDVVLCASHLAGIELDSVVALFWTLAGLVFAIGALVRQRNSDLGRGLRLIPGITLVYISSFFAVSLGYGILLAIHDPDMMDPDMVGQDPVFVAMNLFSIAIDLSLGVVGLLLLRDHRRRVSGTSGMRADSVQAQADNNREPPPAPEREDREE